MTRARRHRARGGFSLVEVLIAIVVLAIGLLALGAAAGLSFLDMNRSRRDMSYWADVQQVADSLQRRGWGNVTTGSTTIRGRAVSWTVTTVNSKTQQVSLLVSRTRYTQLTGTVQDNVLLFLSTP
jgi:prepilin-type N-terminal cleavage/methylation domain-containing protein